MANLPGQEIGLCGLLAIACAPLSRRVRRRMLQARIKSLQGLAIYFEEQGDQARAGLAVTHKQLALAKSELRSL